MLFQSIFLIKLSVLENKQYRLLFENKKVIVVENWLKYPVYLDIHKTH